MNRIYVGNLPFDMDEGSVQNAFMLQGFEIEKIKIVREEDGRSKGFAFLDLKNSTIAEAISCMDGAVIGRRNIRVAPATDNRKNKKSSGQREKSVWAEGPASDEDVDRFRERFRGRRDR